MTMHPAKPHRTLYEPDHDDPPVSPVLFWVLFGALALTSAACIAAALIHAAAR